MSAIVHLGSFLKILSVLIFLQCDYINQTPVDSLEILVFMIPMLLK